jgi:hypothetical protein
MYVSKELYLAIKNLAIVKEAREPYQTIYSNSRTDRLHKDTHTLVAAYHAQADIPTFTVCDFTGFANFVSEGMNIEFNEDGSELTLGSRYRSMCFKTTRDLSPVSEKHVLPPEADGSAFTLTHSDLHNIRLTLNSISRSPAKKSRHKKACDDRIVRFGVSDGRFRAQIAKRRQDQTQGHSAFDVYGTVNLTNHFATDDVRFACISADVFSSIFKMPLPLRCAFSWNANRGAIFCTSLSQRASLVFALCYVQ